MNNRSHAWRLTLLLSTLNSLIALGADEVALKEKMYNEKGERTGSYTAEETADTIKTESDLHKALSYAIAHRDSAFFQILVKQILEVQGWDTKTLVKPSDHFRFPGYTVMHFVCLTSMHAEGNKDEKPEHMKILINAGLDKNVVTGGDGGIRPIHVCAAQGQPEVFRVLIDAGAKPRHLTSGSRMSAATMAARAGGPPQLKVLKILKEAGGKALEVLKARDEAPRQPKSWNPLLYAIRNQHVEIIRFILFEVGLGQVSWKEVLGVARGALQEKKVGQEYIDWLEKLRDNEDGFFEEQKKMHAQHVPFSDGLKKENQKQEL